MEKRFECPKCGAILEVSHAYYAVYSHKVSRKSGKVYKQRKKDAASGERAYSTVCCVQSCGFGAIIAAGGEVECYSGKLPEHIENWMIEGFEHRGDN